MVRKHDTQDKTDRELVPDHLGQGLTILLTLASLLILCFCLYRYDNQYTSGCQQPVDGVLDLREADLSDHGEPYHLQKDWEFYPDVLLEPGDDFSQYPHSIISLGKSTKSLRNEKGSYRLTLLLPDSPMTYALKLPVTFSSYRLYMNDSLLLCVGDLDGTGDTSRELIRDQLITFRASGAVQLLLHYSDESSVHNGLTGLSGLSAPPVLGRPLRIYTMIQYHQIFLAMSVVLILLTLLLSISLFRSWQGSNVAVIVLCITTTLYLTYPLLSSIMIIPAYPWYHLAILFYFACHAAAHWVYALQFHWDDRLAKSIRWYSTGAVIFCAVMLMIFPVLPYGLGWDVFYGCTRAMQWGAVLCGMILSVRMVTSGVHYRLMGAASVPLWLFLLIELIAPDFSPAIFVRLPEMGIILLMDITILVEYVDVASAHRFRLLYAQKISHAESLLKLEERHYAQLSAQIEDTRQVRHDLRQHLRVIRSLLDQGDTKALTGYLEQYVENVQPLLEKPITFFQVPVADALIVHYWYAAQDRGADLQVSGQLQELPKEVYVDFCSIMGNLLENALEAIDHQEPDLPKWIRVRCDIVQKKLMLEVVNSNSVPVRQQNSRFYSTKRDELGMGTFSVSLIAKQYGGVASFSQDGDQFTARVLLPLFGLAQKNGISRPAAQDTEAAPHRTV